MTEKQCLKLVEQFIALYEAMIPSVEKQAEILMKLINADREDLILSIRKVPMSYTGQIISVAKGSLIPELVLDTSPAARALKDMPIDVQRERYLDLKPVTVYDIEKKRAVRVKVTNLTSPQAKQVFNTSTQKIRTKKEQIEFAEIQVREQTRKKKSKLCDAKFTVMPDGLNVRTTGFLSWDTLISQLPKGFKVTVTKSA